MAVDIFRKQASNGNPLEAPSTNQQDHSPSGGVESFPRQDLQSVVRPSGRIRLFFVSFSGIAWLLLAGCSPSQKEGAEKAAFDVEFGKTAVNELFTKGQILYHVDVKSRVIYAGENDYDTVAQRLRVKRRDGKTWELDFGPLKGEFTVASKNDVDKTLTIEENSSSGLKGYECTETGTAVCIDSAILDQSFKLVTADFICSGPVDLICNVNWQKIPVDLYTGKGCPGNPVRTQRSTGLCIQQ